MKKMIAALLAAMLALAAFAGCARQPALDPKEPVSLIMWHVYGSQTESPMNEAIERFNSTVGKQSGVLVQVQMVTDSSSIDGSLASAVNDEPGAAPLPDLFVAYPRVAELFEEGTLLDFSSYFTQQELEAYRAEFLAESYFDGQLQMLPVGKSSELIFLNKTLFDRFTAETGIGLECFESVESLMAAANAYYDWSGQSMFQINDFYHYFLANITALDGQFVVDGKLDAQSEAFARAFAPVAQAGVYGGLCVGDGYASDRWKTGEIIGSAGSTAGILYMRDYVTYDDNTTEDIETLVLPYACLEGGKPVVVHRGGGLFAVKSEDERKNMAAALFAKWLAAEENNLPFVTQSGYLPVTNAGFEALFADLDGVENEKYRMLYSAVQDQYEQDYQFCSLPLYAGAADTQKSFETLMKTTLEQAHEQFVQRTQNGEQPQAVLDELVSAALAQVQSALQ